MAKIKSLFEELPDIRTRSELRTAVARWRSALSLPELQRLVSHAESLEPLAASLRLGIIHTYTSELLDPWLTLAAALHGFDLHTYHGPYGLALQEAQPNSALVKHEPDITLLLLQRSDLHPDLSQPIAGLSSARREELAREVLERLHSIVRQFRAQKVGQVVLTLLPSVQSPELGIYDAQSELSESAWWNRVKAEIGECLRESVKGSLFLDLDEVVQKVGRSNFFDHRFWYSARFPFGAEGAREVARRVIGLGALIKFPKAKVIALDADNTLWGGIIGEDGINGIALGPEYPGNAFLAFQRRLLDYQQRGFLLVLCSKNNPADVDQVFKEHPHQILREEHFAAQRVNWLPKPENLISLAEELNLGLDSFIFVDDSPYDCAAVRHKLPQVEVIQTPAKPVDVPTCLEEVARLEVLSLTAEDLSKTELYAQERRRREFSKKIDQDGGDLGEYLAMLKMKMRIELNSSAQLSRLSQLTQKTNQFNLTTRRYNEHQVREFMLDPDWLVAHFSLADVFGDSGVVGLAVFHITNPQQAELDTFLMSCRVIGREAEAAFLHALMRHLAEQGVNEVIACFAPTKKNELVKNFLPEQGFDSVGDGRYRRDLLTKPPKAEAAFPIEVEMPVQVEQ